MKKIALPLLVLAFLLPAFGNHAADKQTLTGVYVWNSGRPSTLKAIFTATGENRWNVAFHFTFRGDREVFSGTAAGNLSTGSLEGRVKNGNGRRNFTFRGEFENGKFRGKHAEVFGNRESATGTLTLKRKGRLGPGVL